MPHFASWANVVQTFWPVTRQPPFSRTALVFSDARSEPDSGSENPWHQISSAERIGARKRSFCSSVPWAITTGPPITNPSTFAGEGALARAISRETVEVFRSRIPPSDTDLASLFRDDRLFQQATAALEPLIDAAVES